MHSNIDNSYSTSTANSTTDYYFLQTLLDDTSSIALLQNFNQLDNAKLTKTLKNSKLDQVKLNNQDNH